MRKNRCWFRANISRDKIFKSNTIDLVLSDFYGCLESCVEKPLSLRIRMDSALNSYCTITNDEISTHYTKNAMHQLRQAVIYQVEQFFEEFYHYNFEEMRSCIKECLESEDEISSNNPTSNTSASSE